MPIVNAAPIQGVASTQVASPIAQATQSLGMGNNFIGELTGLVREINTLLANPLVQSRVGGIKALPPQEAVQPPQAAVPIYPAQPVPDKPLPPQLPPVAKSAEEQLTELLKTKDGRQAVKKAMGDIKSKTGDVKLSELEQMFELMG